MLQNLDHALFNSFNRGAANGFLDWLMPRITNLHKQPWFFGILLAFLGWYVWRGPRRARVWILCALVAIGISDLVARRVVKELIPRERPCHAVGSPPRLSTPDARMVPGEECPGSPSFPSNHASNMGALAAACFWFTKRRSRWFWLLLPLIIGYSRIYLGYHYPSDVLGGWILGAVIGTGVVTALKRLLGPPDSDGSDPAAESARDESSASAEG